MKHTFRAALSQAVCFAEPKETVQEAFEYMATGAPGSNQQDAFRSRLSTANLSMFCMTGPLNRAGASRDYEYAAPGVEGLAQASIQTVERGTVVNSGDLSAIAWIDDSPGAAHGSFRFDTGTGYQGTCLFQAAQADAAWKITKRVIRKKGSDRLEDGYPVFP